MTNPSHSKQGRMSPVFRYLVLCFYSLLVGFCFMALWLKWDHNIYQKSLREYSSHIYEEGFDAVSVTAPLPRSDRRESFLSRLARRTTPPPDIVTQQERMPDGDQAWQRFAASPVLVPEGNVTVVLVIDDLGILKKTTQEMINLDAPLTLSFLPYASEISKQVEQAYEKGHDILVHIPMEPKGSADAGPHALMSSESERERMQDIDYNLSQFSNYIGINNHMGSEFTEDAAAVEQLLNVIKERELIVLDSKTTPNSKLEAVAREKIIPVVNRDVFLDNVHKEDYILGQLAKLESAAKSNGSALAIGHPYLQTLSALKVWIPTLKEKGITVIPISQSIRKKYTDRQIAIN